jgi:hypothetical protein
MTKATTVLADVGWLVLLWLMVPVVILIAGAPIALLIRLATAAGEWF